MQVVLGSFSAKFRGSCVVFIFLLGGSPYTKSQTIWGLHLVRAPDFQKLSYDIR